MTAVSSAPTVGGLHYSRASAGYDDRMVLAGAMIRSAHEAPEFAGHVVVRTLGVDSLSNRQPAPQFQVAWICRQ